MEWMDQVCERYQLGRPRTEPARLTGGFLHEMYSLFTDRGAYAVKILNPAIMSRATAPENYRVAEELEARLEAADLPIVAANVYDAQKMQRWGGRCFYIYPWYPGRSLASGEIRETHCRLVGRALARMHGLSVAAKPPTGKEIAESHVDWDGYQRRMRDVDGNLFRLLRANTGLLYAVAERGNRAIPRVPPALAVCHNDLDRKNVLWNGEELRIIDLECLSYASPDLELLETALCWAGFEERALSLPRLRAFLVAYREGGREIPADWETLYDANLGHLEWLEYNLKRAAGEECGAPGEQALGVSEVKQTLARIAYRERMRRPLLRFQKELP